MQWRRGRHLNHRPSPATTAEEKTTANFDLLREQAPEEAARLGVG